MPAEPIRTSNQFGRRYIKPQQLWSYAHDLGLVRNGTGGERFLEFCERTGMLVPVCRIRYPNPVVRRLALEEARRDGHAKRVIEPIEQNDEVVGPAAELHQEMCFPSWSMVRAYGETGHILDRDEARHQPFVRRSFPTDEFVPWQDFPVGTYQRGENVINVGDRFYPTYYHYWQVFSLAAVLRSCATIHYDLFDDEACQAIWEQDLTAPSVRENIQLSINLDRRHQLVAMREHETCFEATAYFAAYSNNAFQLQAQNSDEHGRLAARYWRAYEQREREIAQSTSERYAVTPDGLIEFVKAQARLWDDARSYGPTRLTDEFKRNIGETLDFHRALTGSSFEELAISVGRVTTHFEPTLNVVFPSWLREQRDLVRRSLERWLDGLGGVPEPFSIVDGDIEAFCDWLEAHALYQLYWNFQRLAEGSRAGGPVYRAESTADVVSLATFAEMVANAVLTDRGEVVRGKTLMPKLKRVFGKYGNVDLSAHLGMRSRLTSTRTQTLAQRLAQIDRLRRPGGRYNPILRAVLGLAVIRNEGTHLGLLRFDRIEVSEMIETVTLASFAMWKASVHYWDTDSR